MDILDRCAFSRINRVERGIVWELNITSIEPEVELKAVQPFVHDRMVESILNDSVQVQQLFQHKSPSPLQYIDCVSQGIGALEAANQQLGLALSNSELQYIHNWYEDEGRNPTDAELMMFSQVNSEHCRHKIFNASWEFDKIKKPQSMFSMIRETHRKASVKALVAYEDNAAVIGSVSDSLTVVPSQIDRKYTAKREALEIVFKAETHNHPTAISPFPGAASGSGGEIRDEGATGRGGQPKAGVCGFSVSNLRIPNYLQAWEEQESRPGRISSSLQIMLEGPIGAASFNNEFGRPNIAGYFRTFETARNGSNEWHGFHKPIMFAGGIGNIRRSQITKRKLKEHDLLIVLGGPSMLIGLGGGTASSLGQGRSEEELDFASVQRSNPEIQRRCQEVINRCSELNDDNPILSIHDVGAGGLSNAVPEIVHAGGLGVKVNLNEVPIDDPSMSPMENWCNESQERYVLAISPENLESFTRICRRENCPFAVIGVVTSEPQLLVEDNNSMEQAKKDVVDLDLHFLLGGFVSSIFRDEVHQNTVSHPFDTKLDLVNCIERVLRFPSVADKTFLITIGDRTVTGLIHRDQMVGPWQVPVADAAVTLTGYNDIHGEALAIGERSPLAVSNAPASARMAVCEALTNLRSAAVSDLSSIKICANWMAASKIKGEQYSLYESVRTVALDLCVKLGISIPVGKDSLSMFTEWKNSESENLRVRSPISLIATAFAPLEDVRLSLTPQLSTQADTKLLLIDLGCSKNRMGMSALHQSFQVYDGEVPDLESISQFSAFFQVVGFLQKSQKLLAYHDRSDGGVFASLCEMAFAGRLGIDIRLKDSIDPIRFLFNEELGAIIQVRADDLTSIFDEFEKLGILELVFEIGTTTILDRIQIWSSTDLIYQNSRTSLHRMWSELTWKMQSIRDNPQCAQQEYDRILDVDDPGLSWSKYDIAKKVRSTNQRNNHRPRVAILREQGVNGHLEMAAAFTRVGFDAYDVMMSDLLSGEVQLNRFHGLAICGGFSFGDVFGAGRGWAGTILHSNQLSDQFAAFFEDTSKFAFGICNGCQVLAELQSIIPGSERWPKFLRNESEQFEARLVMVEVSRSQALITDGMQGDYLPVPVAHGEGRASFSDPGDRTKLEQNGQVCLRYVNNQKQVTMNYPYNPNGSEASVAGVTTKDGRITAMMPHPERVFRTHQYSWAPRDCGDDSSWLQLFQNARNWLD